MRVGTQGKLPFGPQRPPPLISVRSELPAGGFLVFRAVLPLVSFIWREIRGQGAVRSNAAAVTRLALAFEFRSLNPNSRFEQTRAQLLGLKGLSRRPVSGWGLVTHYGAMALQPNGG